MGSDPFAQRGIGVHQPQADDANAQNEDVVHAKASATIWWRRCAPEAAKGTMRVLGWGYKDGIKELAGV